jgi:peptide-methionine (R)-S-oxide reductase
MINRRWILVGAGGLAALAGFKWLGGSGAQARKQAEAKFEVEKSAAEWRKLLTPAQYRVLREHGTERSFTNPLNDEKRKGTFTCAGCDLPLYSSETKFDSGTGWPSFYQPLPDAVGTSEDYALLMKRTEVHCRRCGGHLGHVFNDGPKPTGLRYCMNGVAMKFVPAADQPA